MSCRAGFKKSTVLLISHSSSIMKDFCQHGVVMEDGRLLEFGSLEDAISYYEASQGG